MVAEASTLLRASQDGRYKRHRFYAAVKHISGMVERDWMDRLADAVDKDGRTLRQISIAAGLRPNFVSQLFTDRKEPSIGKFMKLCRALKVSPLYVYTGAASDPESEEVLSLWASASPELKRAVRTVLATQRPGGKPEVNGDA